MKALTRGLLLAVVVFGALDLWLHRPGTQEVLSETLFSGALSDADIIELRTVDHAIVFERRNAGWWVVSPYEDHADPAFIAQLSVLFERTPDLEVETGDLAPYGLDAGNAIHIDVRTKMRSLGAIDIGFDADGGRTYLRLPGDLVVLAPIGGRHPFDRPESAWRDLQILPWKAEDLATLHIDRDPTFTVRREATLDAAGETHFGPWTRVEVPREIDQLEIQAFAESLGALRATAPPNPEANTGSDDPLLAIHVELGDGSKQILSFSRTVEGTFVRRNAETTVYPIAPKVLNLALQPQEFWTDRNFGEPLSQVSKLTIGKDAYALENGRWVLRGTPANHDKIQSLLQDLSTLRVTRWLPSEKKCPSGLLITADGIEKRRWVLLEDPPRVCDPDAPERQGEISRLPTPSR